MNTSNLFKSLVASFFVLLSISIYPQWSVGNHVIFSTFTNQADRKDRAGNRMHGDFSHNRESGDHGVFFSHKPHFHNYTVHDFRDHFNIRGYTESEILNERCLYMLDEFVKYAQAYPSYKNTIRNLYAELKNLNVIQKAYCIAKGTYCRKLQKRIRDLYRSLDAVKEESLLDRHYDGINITEKPFDPVISEHFAEYEMLQSVYKCYTPNLVKTINERLVIYRNSANSGFGFHPTHKSYNLNGNIKQLLSRSGHDINTFTQCFGNPLQQVIHLESLDILNHVNNLPRSSILYDHQEALVDLAGAIVDYNHEGRIDKAMCVADFCWTLFDYGQAIAEGAALGIYSAVNDILTHPIQATVSIIVGKYILAFQLSKVLYNVADIGVTGLSDVGRAKEKWNTYAEPLNNIIDAINKKEITVRDVVKNGTAFVVGYKAQGKLLGGLGKFCNTIKYKSINFIKNNPLLKPQEYFTTPEGLLFKAASKSNKLKQSGQVNNASNLKHSIDNKIAKTVSSIDQNSAAVLKNDYYEVNGFKFTQFYYNRLWDNGRKCPGFRAESILRGATSVVPDPQGHEGFFKYVYNDWEMIFNPSTKIVAHLSPIAPSKRKMI